MLPRWLIQFRALALALAFAAAFVPIATYITDDKRDWLWIHIGVNIAAYIAVALTTIYTTISLTQQDHNKYRVPAYWANNIIMRTWYLGVSKTWRWHVAAAVGRLGLALALAQHLHIIDQKLGQDFEGIVAPFRYGSHSPGVMDASFHVPPQWETILIAGIVLIVFALIETVLLSSFSLLGYSLWGTRGRSLLTGVALRLGTLVLLIGIMAITHKLFNPLAGDYKYDYDVTLYAAQIQLRDLHTLAFTWLDDGTMLSVVIMRPVHEQLNYACRYFPPVPSSICHYDNRPLIVAEMLYGLTAAVIYGFVILICLQIAHYLNWRQEQGMTNHAPTTS
jgi:hypothetical protein